MGIFGRKKKQEDEDMEFIQIDLDDEEDGDAGEEPLEETETEAERAYRKHKFRKKLLIITGSILGVLVAVYLGFAFYFSSHFLFFTKINGTDYSMKSASQVADQMKQRVADYELTLEETNGEEKIAGKDISLEYVKDDGLSKLIKNQNCFLWVTSLWDHPKLDVHVGVQYDEAKLAEVIGALSCMKEENQTASVNAHPEFKETAFEVVPEVVGTQIDTEKFQTETAKAIEGLQEKLSLMDSGSYIFRSLSRILRKWFKPQRP